MKINKVYLTIVHIIFLIMTVLFLLPFLIIVIISVTPEAQISSSGFSLIPNSIDFSAYKYLFADFGVIMRSIIWTVFLSLTTPILPIIAQACMAYALNKKTKFLLRKPTNVLLTLAMFISGGMIPTYIVLTQWYHLGNNPLIYFFNSAWVSLWGVSLYKTFFKGVSPSLIEAAQIDGASEFKILMKIVVPMCTPILAMQYFTGVIGTWNSWQVSMIYMQRSEELWTFQYYLQRVMENSQIIINALKGAGIRDLSSIPITTMKYAECALSVIPVLCLFPLIQKYFAKGIAVGSVKG